MYKYPQPIKRGLFIKKKSILTSRPEDIYKAYDKS